MSIAVFALGSIALADGAYVCGHSSHDASQFPWRESVIDPRYHTYDEVNSYLDSVADLEQYDSILEVIEVGVSTNENLPILAAKISDNPDVNEDEAAVLFLGQCHAEEILGLEITIGLIDSLLQGYDSGIPHIMALIQNLEIWLIPTYNPEGLKVVHDGWDVTYRKNKTDNNGNGSFDFDEGIGFDIDGIDLNRNYDFNWIFGDDYLFEDYDYFRGFEPFSESEEVAIAELAKREQFMLSIAYHSARSGTPEIVYYSWQWEDTKYPPDYPVIDDLAQTLAARIVNESGDGNYASHPGTTRRGNAHDWFYTQTGCIQFLVECGTNNLQPAADLVDDTVERNLEGTFYLLDRALGFPPESRSQIRGIVRDASDGFPLEGARVRLNRLVAGESNEELEGGMMQPRLTDEFGRYRRLVLPGTYEIIASAPGFAADTITGISASDNYPTELDIMLAPFPQRVFGLQLAPKEDLSVYEVILADENSRDTLLMVAGSYQFTRNTDVLDLTVLGEGYFPESFHIICDSFPANEPIITAVDLADSYNVLTHNFNDLQRWTAYDDAWTVSNGTLATNAGLIYSAGDNLRLASPEFGTSYWQRLGFTIHHAYEVEWKYDTIAVKFYDHETDTLIWAKSWNDQQWETHSETYFTVKDLPLFARLELTLQADSTVEYRGWLIDSINVFVSQYAPVAVDPIREDPGNNRIEPAQARLAPNPVLNRTSLSLTLPAPQQVSITVYDMLGRLVREEHLTLQGGKHNWVWQGEGGNGQRVPAGVYFMRVASTDLNVTRKLLLLNP